MGLFNRIIAGAVLLFAGIQISLAETVSVLNFVRAESDHYMARYVDEFGIGNLGHVRNAVAIDEQEIIRTNRDTIYSIGVFDLTHPLTITMPDPGDRYMSLQLVSQDHYTFIEEEPGRHTFTKSQVGTQYMAVIVRVFMDPNDASDVAEANQLQDRILLEQEDKGAFTVTDWDVDSLTAVRELLLGLAATATDAFDDAFGVEGEVDPVMHLLGAAAGWGGNPPEEAVYPSEFPEQNDGTVPHVLTVKDVPVDAFWSITVYNADGFMQENDLGAYSYNDVTAEKNSDGSITVHFGACEDGRVNCLPIMKGWNYVVRLYRPRQEILDGSWTFPTAEPLK